MTTKKKLKNIVEKKESLLIRALIERVSFQRLKERFIYHLEINQQKIVNSRKLSK